jgi:hypothetical protein
MHRYAIGATGAPLFRMFNNKIQAKQVSHNAGVGGSSPPVATISVQDLFNRLRAGFFAGSAG